jgi:predicted deacylase
MGGGEVDTLTGHFVFEVSEAYAIEHGKIGDPVRGATLTGDTLLGKPVISALEVDALETGRHQFYFRGVEGVGGQPWHVSVTVVKGARPGKRALLTSGVHGDEISSIRTVQQVMAGLDPAAVSGAVTAAFDISRPALEGMARRWPSSGRGIDLVDMNRVWPGDRDGPSAPARHAALLFEGLFRRNADFAIDFHSVATGMDSTAFHLADMSRPEIAEMAMLYPIDQIFDSTGGYGGLLANELVAAGIPAFTPEVGRPRVLDPAMIARFVEGTMNVLRHHGIVAGEIGRTGRDSGVFTGDAGYPVVATHGGLVELLVEPREAVAAGQKVAVQYDAFGDVVAEYSSRVAGQVATRRTDATCEPGTTLMVILFDAGVRAPETVYPE